MPTRSELDQSYNGPIPRGLHAGPLPTLTTQLNGLSRENRDGYYLARWKFGRTSGGQHDV